MLWTANSLHTLPPPDYLRYSGYLKPIFLSLGASSCNTLLCPIFHHHEITDDWIYRFFALKKPAGLTRWKKSNYWESVVIGFLLPRNGIHDVRIHRIHCSSLGLKTLSISYSL